MSSRWGSGGNKEDSMPMRYLLGVRLPSLAALSVLAGEAVARGGRVTAKYPRRPQQQVPPPQLVARLLPFTVTSTPPPRPEDMTLSEAVAGNDALHSRHDERDSGTSRQRPGDSNRHRQRRQRPANSSILPGQCRPQQHERQPLPQAPHPCCSGCPLVINSSPQSLMRSRRALYEALLTLEATGAAAPPRQGGEKRGGAIAGLG